MPHHERVIAEVRDPDGRVVVLLERIWAGQIASDHPELAGYQKRCSERCLTRITSSPTRGSIAGASTVVVSARAAGCWCRKL